MKPVFGIKLWGRTEEVDPKDDKPSGQLAFTYDESPEVDRVVQDYGGGTSGLEYTYGQVPTEEVTLVNKYRDLSVDADVEEAIGEIRNEVFVFNENSRPIELDFTEDCKLPASVKKRIHEEFLVAYRLLDFNKKGLKWFEDWLVDSKLVFHKVIDEERPQEGVQRLMPIDPLCIRKIRRLPKPDVNGFYDPTKIEDFYVYTPDTQRNSKTPDLTTVAYSTRLQGMVLSQTSVTSVDSGLVDRKTKKVIGYLYKVIAPFNQLRGMEDAMMIYRLARAPSRRAFYIDVSSLGKTQGEAYIKDVMRRHGSKVTYDPATGTIANKRSVLSVTEDYWLPRRDGKNTEIATIDGQDTSNILEEVQYYRNRLYGALGVPRNRFGQEQSSFNFGKGVEIDRDEYRFRKFIDRMRSQFMNVFLDVMKTNLILKKVIEPEEWEDIAAWIVWRFEEDNAFVEWREAEVINSRLATMRDASDLIGKYVSSEWAAKTILKMSDAEIAAEKEKIKKERKEEEAFGGGVDIPPEAGPLGPTGGAPAPGELPEQPEQAEQPQPGDE